MNILNIFKKKEKNKLLVSWKWEGNLQNSSDILEPGFKNIPSYWKNLSKGFSLKSSIEYKSLINKLNSKDISEEETNNIKSIINKSKIWNLGNNTSRINASHCPSFVELFKNSYVYKSPCDIYVKIDDKGFNIISTNENLFNINPHSLSSQLWGDFNNNIINIKFQSDLYVQTSLKKTKLIALDNIYYSDLPFRVMPGVLEVSNKFPVSLNLNTYIDKRFFENKNYEKLVKAGTPLGVYYVPSGVLPIKDYELLLSPPKYFIGDYLKKLNEK